MNRKLAYSLVSHALSTASERPKLCVPHIDEGKRRMVGTDGFRFVSLVIDEKVPYPDYDHITPSSHLIAVSVAIDDLVRVARIAQPNSGVVRIELTDNDGVDYLSFRQQTFNTTSVIQCAVLSDNRENEQHREWIHVALNTIYLAQCANAMQKYVGKPPRPTKKSPNPKPTTMPQNCTIQFSKSTDPVVFIVEDYTEVISPMFVEW